MLYSLYKISGSTYNLLNDETGQIKNVNILYQRDYLGGHNLIREEVAYLATQEDVLSDLQRYVFRRLAAYMTDSETFQLPSYNHRDGYNSYYGTRPQRYYAYLLNLGRLFYYDCAFNQEAFEQVLEHYNKDFLNEAGDVVGIHFLATRPDPHNEDYIYPQVRFKSGIVNDSVDKPIFEGLIHYFPTDLDEERSSEVLTIYNGGTNEFLEAMSKHCNPSHVDLLKQGIDLACRDNSIIVRSLKPKEFTMPLYKDNKASLERSARKKVFAAFTPEERLGFFLSESRYIRDIFLDDDNENPLLEILAKPFLPARVIRDICLADRLKHAEKCLLKTHGYDPDSIVTAGEHHTFTRIKNEDSLSIRKGYKDIEHVIYFHYLGSDKKFFLPDNWIGFMYDYDNVIGGELNDDNLDKLKEILGDKPMAIMLDILREEKGKNLVIDDLYDLTSVTTISSKHDFKYKILMWMIANYLMLIDDFSLDRYLEIKEEWLKGLQPIFDQETDALMTTPIIVAYQKDVILGYSTNIRDLHATWGKAVTSYSLEVIEREVPDMGGTRINSIEGQSMNLAKMKLLRLEKVSVVIPKIDIKSIDSDDQDFSL